MKTRARLILKSLALLLIGAVSAVVAIRAWNAWRDEPLERWHTHVPADVVASEIDQLDWPGYLAAEDRLMAEVERDVVGPADQLDATGAYSRYAAGSGVHRAATQAPWNRSHVLRPDRAEPVGVAVMLHGLTDSPYSLRHTGEQYRQRGYVVVGLRLPGHGTVPAGLTRARWVDWLAATRLAVRQARALVPQGRPLHLVGYSTGAALAVRYSLDALEDPALARPARLVLISPLVGLTEFTRFAGIAAWPAVMPPFARAAWLGVMPEFNPFKYNSFPIRAATESHDLTQAVQDGLAAAQRKGTIAQLPPMLTFVSVVDATVSVRAVVDGLYRHLPANGSELVLFDVNRTLSLQPLMRPVTSSAMDSLTSPAPRRYDIRMVSNADTRSPNVTERVEVAGSTAEQTRPLELAWPPQIISLSHIALPFPPDDALYGLTPDPREDFGIQLGTMAVRGERGVLAVDLRQLMRLSSNPMYAYMAARIDAVAAPR